MKMQRLITLYGYYTFLFLIKELEEQESFEQCQIILDGLNSIDPDRYSHLPKPADLTIEMYMKDFDDYGLSGQTAAKNLPGYVRELKMKLIEERILGLGAYLKKSKLWESRR